MFFCFMITIQMFLTEDSGDLFIAPVLTSILLRCRAASAGGLFHVLGRMSYLSLLRWGSEIEEPNARRSPN